MVSSSDQSIIHILHSTNFLREVNTMLNGVAIGFTVLMAILESKMSSPKRA